jgi:DNA-binding transcriptional MerR regulator
MSDDASSNDGLDLNALCLEAGVTPRTVYYYTQQGLLPPPGSGRGVRYSETHRLRLAWIRHRQKSHLPLAAIRMELERLRDREIAELLASEPGSTDGPAAMAREAGKFAVRQSDSAFDYTNDLLGLPRSLFVQPTSAPGKQSDPFSSPTPEPATAPPRSGFERSIWERHRFGDDVEVHIRRPLDRATNRKIDRLLELIRQLFNAD